jgi:hypothetical protein
MLDDKGFKFQTTGVSLVKMKRNSKLSLMEKTEMISKSLGITELPRQMLPV